MGGCFLLGIILLVGPVATWLQARDIWADTKTPPDAVYLVCGAQDQPRRIRAAADYLACAQTGSIPILIGNDALESLWSREEQRNLTMAEWAVRRLRDELGNLRPEEMGAETSGLIPHPSSLSLEIVPGHFFGTDGEMAALADYLYTRTNTMSIALATSPYHIRRAAWRLETHLRRDLDVYAIGGEPIWMDRAPWIVFSEAAKMVRDRLGLSRAPIVSRRFWAGSGRAE